MSTKLTIDQAFELRRAAPSVSSSTQRKPAVIAYWISQSTFVAISVIFGFLFAFAVQRKFGAAEEEKDDEQEEGDYRNVLALAASVSAVLLLLFANRFQGLSKQVAQATAESLQIHTPVKPTGGVENSIPLTPKQIHLIGCTPQELNEHRKQVDSILSPHTPAAVRAKPSSGTPAPPSTPAAATPAKSSTNFIAAAAASSTPVGSPFRVSQDDAKYLSPQSPLVYQAPRTPAAAAAATPTASSPFMSPAIPAPPPPSTPGAIVQLKTSAKKPVSDEHAAFVLVDQVEKEGKFNMEDAVLNFKRALYVYIKDEVLGRLDDVHDKLASVKINSNQWYPLAVLEWEELKDVQEMHAFQVETLSLTDRQELRRLLRQRKQLEKYFEVKRRGNMVPFPRNYVLKRLRSLLKSGKELSAFHWSGGETFNRSGTNTTVEWNSDELPTDAEVIFRIVCVWFDKCLKREMVGSFEDSVEEDSFSLLHVREEAAAAALNSTENREWWGFVSCGTSSSTTQTATMDMLSPLTQSTFHPHWKVMVGGKVWEVCYGRSNLFHAVVLFLYSLRTNMVSGRVNDIITEVFGKQ